MMMLPINQIIQSDCLEFMKSLPDKCVDLVLTDPPYGIGEANGKNISRNQLAQATNYGYSDWDSKPLSFVQVEQLKRISRNQIVFGGNYAAEHLGNSSCWIVWDKDNSGDFSDCELVWTSFKSAVRKIVWRWNGMLQEDMKNKEKRQHPTQKPLGVMRWIIENYSKPTDLILDPFCGSGTTCVAAELLGRKWIGVEISEQYCEIARKRVKEAQEQFSLLELNKWPQNSLKK